MTEVVMDKAASATADPEIERSTVRKVALRLMWFVMAMYFLAILDRGNISFAALQMNKELGLNAEMFGIAVGIMYFTYSIFEIPSNLILSKYGARITLTRIAILWGIATVLMAFTQGPLSLYAFRGFLGFAESGLFPGVMLLLSLWFPFSYRARYNAMFNYAVPISYIFASLISGAILELNGTFGISGWKWLFILEGVPPIILGIVGIFYLTDRPQQASWLSAAQRNWLTGALERDARATGVVHAEGVLRTITKPMVLLFGLCNFGLFCGLASLFPWLPQIIKSFGLPNSQVGFVTAIPPIAGLIGMIALSRHSDHVGERFYYAATTFVIAAVGFAIAAFSTSPAWIIVGFMVANVGVYGTQAVFWTIPQSYMSRQSAPGAIGLVGMIGSIGGATIPIVIGRAKDTSGSFTTGFLVVTGVLLVAAVLVLIARTRLVKE
ncbi:MFS transporter [Bradyrhizobium sp. C9]|uniref:MFS transporter n=1 Tax=Bradyrhizobium sp. C9 TaxID=142585 RepID=UPI000BE8512A|nr:MFS transporter [Bradyrhizobium sp. C9]PDT71412.1 MFS transporter [Bradyrhizobium sp. C9]